MDPREVVQLSRLSFLAAISRQRQKAYSFKQKIDVILLALLVVLKIVYQNHKTKHHTNSFVTLLDKQSA